MTKILAELQARPVRAGALLLVTGVWSFWTLATLTGRTGLPAPPILQFGVPAGLLTALIVAEQRDRILVLCASWSALLVTATFMSGLVAASPTLALAPLVLLASSALCMRFPSATTVGLFALSGFYGSMQAFTGVSGALLADVLIGGMWTGLLLSRLAGTRTRVALVWPAMLVLGFYIAVTLVDVLTADGVAPAILSFRLSTWYLLAVVLLAYAGFSSETYMRIARGAVMVAFLVGAYATLRWFIGPAASEYQFALTVGGAFNFVDGELRTFGSFGSGHQLGFWAGMAAPFCLAAALGWRGRWRAIAATAFGVCTFAVLASEVRGALIGLVLGVGIVLVAHNFASSPRRLSPVRALVALACVGALTGTLFVTAGGNEGVTRYEAILDPSNDPAYLRRAQKLAAAMPEIREEPLGHGLGSASLNASLRPPFVNVTTYSLDNSFLRIAYEQGMPVMLVFAAALLALLLRLLTGAARAPHRDTTALAIGGAGTLASTAALFYSGMYNEDLLVLGAWMLIGLGAGSLLRDESARAPAPLELAAETKTRALSARGEGARQAPLPVR